MLKIEKITDKHEEMLDVKGQNCHEGGKTTTYHDCNHDCETHGGGSYKSKEH